MLVLLNNRPIARHWYARGGHAFRSMDEVSGDRWFYAFLTSHAIRAGIQFCAGQIGRGVLSRPRLPGNGFPTVTRAPSTANPRRWVAELRQSHLMPRVSAGSVKAEGIRATTSARGVHDRKVKEH